MMKGDKEGRFQGLPKANLAAPGAKKRLESDLIKEKIRQKKQEITRVKYSKYIHRLISLNTEGN